MRSTASLFSVLLLLGSMGQVMADLYLPSLPFISTNLAVSVNSVQWSISIYMWGFALSQLVYGQLSDAVGRKLPLLVGILLTLVGSAVCMFAPSITWLIAGRFIQGLGAGSGVILSRVILRDIYSGNKLAKFASYLSVAGVPIMAGAPLLGGIIQHFLGWRENFIFLTLYAVVALLVVVIFLDETNVNRNMKHLHWRQMLTNIATLAKNPLFIGLSLIIFLTYAGILAWLTTAPIFLQLKAGLSSIGFGLVGLITGFAYSVAGLSNASFVMRYGLKSMMGIGLAMMVIGGLLMLILAMIFHQVGIVITILPIAIFFAGTGFIFANGYAAALQPFPQIAGVAGSLFGFMQIAGGAVASGLLAHLDESNQMPLAWIITVVATIAFCSYLLVKKLIHIPKTGKA